MRWLLIALCLVGFFGCTRTTTPHYFVNTGAHPAAAFVTFAPPYDGEGQVPSE